MVSLTDGVTCTGNGDVVINKPRLHNTIVNKITKNATLMVRGKIMIDNCTCCIQNLLLIKLKINTRVYAIICILLVLNLR